MNARQRAYGRTLRVPAAPRPSLPPLVPTTLPLPTTDFSSPPLPLRLATLSRAAALRQLFTSPVDDDDVVDDNDEDVHISFSNDTPPALGQAPESKSSRYVFIEIVPPPSPPCNRACAWPQ